MNNHKQLIKIKSIRVAQLKFLFLKNYKMIESDRIGLTCNVYELMNHYTCQLHYSLIDNGSNRFKSIELDIDHVALHQGSMSTAS